MRTISAVRMALRHVCAPALLTIAAMGTLAQNAPPARPRAAIAKAAGGYRIAGTVVNAATGEPVRRATVAVLSEEDSHTVGAVESDSDGHFALDGLAAAKYQLTASKRGFRTAFYDEHEEFSTAIVTGEGQDTAGLVFRLTPGATLHGVVTGDGGDPVEGAKMMLFERPRTHGRAPGPGERTTQANTTTTDDTGAYDFDNLAAGEYLVAVTAQPWYAVPRSRAGSSTAGAGTAGRPGTENDAAATLDVAYPVTFFDSTTDEGSATRIVLAGGGREEADINLHAVPALHLVVETPRRQDGSIARAELRQTIFGIEISSESAGFLDAMRTGTVEFTGVAPGHYELAQGDPPRIADLDASASQQVDPSLGTATVAVAGTLRAAPGFVLPEDVSVRLNSLDGAHSQSLLQANCIRGAFNFAAVAPGAWELEADAPGRTLPISSVTVGNRVNAGNQVTVRDRPVQVVATVSLGETRVEGFARKVRAPGDRSAGAGVEVGRGKAGAMVVLVPKEPGAFRSLVRRDQSDSDGSFSLHDVAPGQYTVVAIEDGWDLDWARPEVIGRYLPQGIAVTVTERQGKLVRLSEPVPVQSR
ncbi:MAG: carboxypeptidase-like regulatory domain-containing protein [Terracidiphilus sp.]